MDEIDYKHLLLTLLAVIHRDGGHYELQHGPEKATVDAMKIFLKEGREPVPQNQLSNINLRTGLDLDDEGKVRCYS